MTLTRVSCLFAGIAMTEARISLSAKVALSTPVQSQVTVPDTLTSYDHQVKEKPMANFGAPGNPKRARWLRKLECTLLFV